MKQIFIILLITRSSLDIFTDVGINIGPMNLNVPSMISLFILFIAVPYFILKGKIQMPVIGEYFGVWLLFLIITVFLSLYNFGMEGAVAIREWIRLATFFVILVLAYNIIGEKDANKYFNAILFSLFVPLSVGIYQLITHTGWRDHDGILRIYGTFAQPNQFVFYLVLFLGLTIWRWKYSSRKILLGALLFIQLICLIATLSLRGYIMAGILFAGYFLKMEHKRKIYVFLIVILFISILSNTGQFQERMERIRQIDVRQTVEEGGWVDSSTWRIVNWQGLFSLWWERPLLGYGLESTVFINPRTRDGLGISANNDFIAYLLETGLIGFLIYLTFIFFVGLSIYWNYSFTESRENKELLYVLSIVFIAALIGSLGGDMIKATTFHFYFWATLGVSLKLNRYYENSSNQ